MCNVESTEHNLLVLYCKYYNIPRRTLMDTLGPRITTNVLFDENKDDQFNKRVFISTQKYILETEISLKYTYCLECISILVRVTMLSTGMSHQCTSICIKPFLQHYTLTNLANTHLTLVCVTTNWFVLYLSCFVTDKCTNSECSIKNNIVDSILEYT